MSSDRGSVLLLVLVATSGLAMMTSMLLLSGRIAYEIAGLRADRMQAEALAEGTVRQAIAALEDGTVAPPAAGSPLRVLNGVVLGGDLLPVARFPAPPAGSRGGGAWPAVTEDPWVRPPGGGHGAELELAAVAGPRGEGRARVVGGPGVLIRATVRAWFRGAVAERTAALHLLPDGSVRRLD